MTIDDEGFRTNDGTAPTAGASILVTGDSFTFGDQVSNNETWAACLERKTGRETDNGGVFGFGAAQALKRAVIETGKRPYGAVVWSVLVGGDFERDQMDYRIGFPRPAVVKTASGVGWAPVSDPKAPGTRYNPTGERFWPVLAYDHSLIAATLMDRLMDVGNLTGDRLQTVHPDAAPVDEIIEWSIGYFAGMDVAERVLVMQYREDTGREEVVRQRRLITKVAARHPAIRLVDTFDAVTKDDVAKVWNEHHTAFGNELVCQAVAGAFATK